MKNFFSTNPNNITAMVIRIFLGLVIFPHGAQKLLGWFGGYGYGGTMGFLTGTVHLPYIIGVLVILVEFFGALMLIFGLATRLAALGMLVNFLGIIFTSHINNGFFINWSNAPNKGHGVEYDLLVIGICIALLIAGGGKASLDAAFQEKKSDIAHLKRPLVA
ncbi:MAG: DoxX family protein [Flavisolibacter sp.]